MRSGLLIVPLIVCAQQAAAQAPAAPQQVPPQLTDPAVTQKLANSMQALSKAFLDLRVGEVQAALEGRQATPSEKRMTVRDLGRQGDPNFERNLQQQVANAKPMIDQGMKALASALPAMMQGMEQAEKAMERAAANMPDPTYPKR
jgi:hypothetical protein